MITWLFGKNKTKETLQVKEKDNFVSLASHQLRTPLSVIKWYTEMLLDEDAGPLTEDQRKYLTTIQTSNQQSIDLVKSLLNVSRLDLGTFCIVPVEVDVKELTEEILVDFKKDLEGKQIILKKEYKEDSLVITSDRKMCLVAIKNIISNAISYSKPGGEITLIFSTVQKGEFYPSDGVNLSVCDKGVGIPEQDQDKISLKMFKASNSKDSDATGSGFGLYIAKSALLSVGGKMYFASKEGQGSTFSIFLPKNDVQAKKGTTTLD